MIFQEAHSHYDVLELSPEASQQEIQEAYNRLKMIYSKDSLAFYSLMERDSTADILHLIEQAYATLSSPHLRHEYDRTFISRLMDTGGFPSSPEIFAVPEAEVFSIDRVPPMESLEDPEELLTAPQTEFSPSTSKQESPKFDPIPEPRPAPTRSSERAPERASAPAPTSSWNEQPNRPLIERRANRSFSAKNDEKSSGIQEKIRYETEWQGQFIRSIRELRGISVEDLCAATKVSKRYIHAIEEENFEALPAAVFLRGFLIQIARKLQLPAEQVASAYVGRYKQARPSKG